MARIFITGGAGFIGKSLSIALASAGYEVTVYDNLQPQVHSDPERRVVTLMNKGISFVNGDVRDAGKLGNAIQQAEPSIVVHLAAETGTGQSYDLPGHYCDVNVTGTAHLIEGVRAARQSGVDVRRMILASSRAVYGEGACVDKTGVQRLALPRRAEDLANEDYAPKDADGNELRPVPSCAATTSVTPASIYA